MTLVRRLAAVALAAAIALALSACGPAHGDWQGESTVIASGSRTGVYYEYGKHLADELGERLGVAVTVAETNGSVDNLLRVAAGDAVVGFAQGDAAGDAVAGTGGFEEPLPL